MKFIKKIKVFIIITALLAMANQSFSDQVSIVGKVTKIESKTITIETTNADTIPTGSRVDLFFQISEDQSIEIGQWKVSGRGNGVVFATPVDVLGPPQEGMTAKISYSGGKTVQVIRQDHHNSPPISQNEKPYEEKQFVYNPPQDADKAKAITNEGHKGAKTGLDLMEPQLRGKEPKGQLLGIPFPEKSAKEYAITGDKYYNEKNYKMAFKEYQQASLMGHAGAQNRLGHLYYNGWGVNQNYGNALEWYEKSSMQNHAGGLYNLGVVYSQGQGVKKDMAKAHELFLQSANLGNPEAQFNLGAIYYNGMGVEKDKSTALKWFEKAADQNLPKALYIVGQAHEFGWGTPKNISKAKEYYKKAADLGDENAMKRLSTQKQNKSETIKKVQTLEPEAEKMFTALYVNDFEIVRQQLDKGVDPNAKNDTGQTPLHVTQDLAIAKMLILRGADVNATDGDGMTPVFNKEIDLIKVLIESGADINQRSNKGNTPLIWYSYSGYLEGVQYLLSLGADVNAKNLDGQTAYDIAERFAHLKLLGYLNSTDATSGKHGRN